MVGTLPLLLPILALRVGPLEFGQPTWLFALLILLPVFYIWKTSRVPASPSRRWVGLILRCVLIGAIIFSLADTRMVWHNRGICVAFVLDQSQSVPGEARDRVRDRIKTELDKMTKDDRFVVVEFGGDAVLGSLPSLKGDLPAPVKVNDAGHTDIARALRVAMASFPADRQKRIVLFSDGNQNQEDALREARIAGVKDVDVDVVPVLAQRGHEVMVDQILVPPHVRKDARFMVRAIISSDIAQDTDVIVSRDGAPYATLQQSLKSGSNVIDIPNVLGDAEGGGAHRFQVTVVPHSADNDTFAANNTGYAITQVDAPGKVLLVEGKNIADDFLLDALRSASVPVVATNSAGLPGTTDELAGYDCVILNNVNYYDVANSPQLPALKKWVEDFGGGLVLIGGDDSFGPGAYKDTILEELSPVEMDVKREKHLASLAVAVVCDRSGSMGAPAGGGRTKMDLANEGAAQVARLLDSQDLAMLGVVDTEVHWVDDFKNLIPMTATNKQRLISGVQTVRSGGGGIYCETALDHAYRMVNAPSVHTMSKHVIMFADAADSEQQDNCVAMATKNFQQFGVTTSVIGMGNMGDPDVSFQKAVAAAGHGRFFITDDPLAIPRLFVKEAFMVSRKAFIEKPEGIQPTPYNSPLLQGFINNGSAALPKIYGYVGTTLKPRATLALHGEQADDPLLAHWVIGLGKCVAYTSDSTSRWGKDWVSWNGYSKFWSQVVRWVSRATQGANGITTTTLIDGSDGRIVLDAVDPTGKPINNLQLQASVIAPDQSSETKGVPLEQIAPGRYQGHFTASQRGTYLVAVAEGEDRQLISTGGGVLSYPPEYRDLQPNLALLHSVADASNGQFLNGFDGVFQQKPYSVSTFWPLWQDLLVIVTAGLLADVAWRRLNFGDWFRHRSLAGMPVIATSDASLGALRTVKSGRRDVDSQRKSMRERVQSLAAAPETPVMAPQAMPLMNATATIEKPGHSLDPAENPPESAAGETYATRLMSAKKRAKEHIRDQEKEAK